MSPLPFIDDHHRLVTAPPERAWVALLQVVGGMAGRTLPGPLARVWGLERRGSGDWRAPSPGDTLVGFTLTELEAPRLLVLTGRHRFSEYELRFTVEPAGPDRAEVHAVSRARFPGALGAVYRALVIGSRGHVLAVRRMLAQVARRAEHPA